MQGGERAKGVSVGEACLVGEEKRSVDYCWVDEADGVKVVFESVADDGCAGREEAEE